MKKRFVHTRLRRCREQIGLSQEGLIMELSKNGVSSSRNTIYNWETGETTPNVEQLATLSIIFGKPISYFFTFRHNKTSDVKAHS